MLRRILPGLLAAWLACAAQAEPVVVVGARHGGERLSREEVVYVFMGRLRQLPSGLRALPLDLPEGSSERQDFYRRLLHKGPDEIRAYWARLVFTGGARPPQVVDGYEALVSQLQRVPGAIAYLERSRVDARLKIVFEFPVAGE